MPPFRIKLLIGECPVPIPDPERPALDNQIQDFRLAVVSWPCPDSGPLGDLAASKNPPVIVKVSRSKALYAVDDTGSDLPAGKEKAIELGNRGETSLAVESGPDGTRTKPSIFDQHIRDRTVSLPDVACTVIGSNGKRPVPDYQISHPHNPIGDSAEPSAPPDPS
jgi:hypothetical protein